MFFLWASVVCFLFPSTHSISVRDYGARGDGVSLDTTAIQKTIDQASSVLEEVYFPPGAYYTGAIFLRSNTLLNIDISATIMASYFVQDYPDLTKGGKWALVQALSVNNITITGGGQINGQAYKYYGEWDAADNRITPVTWEGVQDCDGECRPRLITFENVTDVNVNGVTLRDSPDWTFDLLGCKNVVIDSIRIYGDPRWPNNDGIDIDWCQNVLVNNVLIDTGDDGICLKTSEGYNQYGMLSNVTVVNSSVSSKSSALKFGSATYGNMSDCLFDHINIYNSHRGIGIQARDNGDLWNIVFQNINIQSRYYGTNWWGRGEGIWISNIAREPDSTVGNVYNIAFTNITAVAENSVFVSGFTNAIINVTFQNLFVTIEKFSNFSLPQHDYRPTDIHVGTVNAPVDGIYIEYANTVKFITSKLTWGSNKQTAWSYACLNAINSSGIDSSGLVC